MRRENYFQLRYTGVAYVKRRFIISLRQLQPINFHIKEWLFTNDCQKRKRLKCLFTVTVNNQKA